MTHFDVAIVGAGIAGASVAAHLPADRRVLLIEGEDVPGFHSTGRSAAIFSAIYGNAPVRALTRASLPFLAAPPAGFSDDPLLGARGVLFLADESQLPALDAMRAQPDVREGTRDLTAGETASLVSFLSIGHVARALYEPDAFDLDVNALHMGYLRRAKAQGVRHVGSARVSALDREDGRWRIVTSQSDFTAGFVINAAGAWADDIARMAGARPRGITAMRRTMVLVDIAGDPIDHRCPMVVDVDEKYYFRPESGGLLLSPADETPVEPGDVQPEELDIAIAIDRVERATGLTVRRVRSSWAGLRNFAPDRTPAVGFDADAPNFFWLAGQGGYGIQTAPALGRLAAALVMGEAVPDDLIAHGVDPAALHPSRPALAGEAVGTPA